MNGNIWEMCENPHSSEERTDIYKSFDKDLTGFISARGGAYDTVDFKSMSYYSMDRSKNSATWSQSPNVGFRIIKYINQ